MKKSLFGGRFKVYWICGLIALIFLGLQFTSVNPGEEIDQSKFLTKLSNNEIKSVTFVRNTGIAEIEVKDKSERPPHYYFSYGDLQYLNTKMDEIELDASDPVNRKYRDENQMFGEILSWILPLIFIVLIIISAIGWFKVYKKTGFSGWTSLIPVYRTLILLKIINKPWHWIFLFFIPLVNIVFIIWSMNLLSKNFGKDEGFTVGLLLLPFIFIPILGFDNSEYKKRITK